MKESKKTKNKNKNLIESYSVCASDKLNNNFNAQDLIFCKRVSEELNCFNEFDKYYRLRPFHLSKLPERININI